MSITSPSNRSAAIGIPGMSSTTIALPSYLKQGIECFRTGNYVKGVALLVQAREQLPAGQVYLASVIDALLQGYAERCQAQEALLEASRRFALAETEQQERLDDLVKLLASSEEEMNSQSQPGLELLSGSSRQYPSVVPMPAQQRMKEPAPLLSSSQALAAPDAMGNGLPDLYIVCFGRFKVLRGNLPIALCNNRSGQAILRYLVAQPDYRATMDVLMAVLWPEEDPDVARHKLQVAISALRRSLNNGYDCDPGAGYILYKDYFYQINPAISLRSDVDDFLALYQAGRDVRESEMIACYEQASQLYTGPFLVEDTYADWSLLRREQLRQMYLAMCGVLSEYYLNHGRYEDAAHWADVILEANRSDEMAHCLLIRIYAAQGRRGEAVRQYQRCERILHDELGVTPMPETERLFQEILLRK